MRRLFLAGMAAVAMALGLWSSSQNQVLADDAPDKIVMGYAVSLSGPYAPGAGTTTIGNYKLWLHDVNEAGGIYLSKYDKKVPVEFIEYDDRSQLEEAVRLTEKLMISDKVDFVLAPWGTATHMAVAPLYERHGYPLLALTASAEKIKDLTDKWTHAFWMLRTPTYLTTPIIDLVTKLRDEGQIGNKVAMIFVADQLGVEMANAAVRLLDENGFELVYNKNYPLGASDLSPQIKEVMRLEPDVFLSMSYPLGSMMVTEQSMTLGFNPKVMYVAVGPAHPYFIGKFGGAKNLEGLLSMGGGDPQLQSVQEYHARYREIIGEEPDLTGGPGVYASLEILQQAIERVGEVDREKVTEVIRTETFDTITGPMRFENQLLVNWWAVGQFQGGQWVGVAPTSRESAQPIQFPKPTWKDAAGS